jgi:chromosome segregation ATPase
MSVYTEFEGNDRMADEEIPENVDLRFLATQSARILWELGEARAERGELRADVTGIKADITGLRADIGGLRAESKTHSELLGKVMDVTLELAKGQEKLTEAVQIIEHDISGIKMRVERIERHTGLVKA